MAGPWEKYAQPSTQDGPWAKYATPVAPSTPASPSTSDVIKQGVIDLVAGGIRGAGSIGSTLLYPIDKATDLIKGDRGPNVSGLVTGKQPMSRNEERRKQIDEGLTSLTGDLFGISSNPNNLLYKAGKFGGEVAGTAGTGGVLAKGAQAVGATPTVVNALASGGMAGGGNMLTRASAGAVTGGASAGLVNPDDAKAGAVFGGAMPIFVKGMGVAGQFVADKSKDAAKSLMQSSIKPTLKQLKTGEANTAVDTLLQYGLSPNQKGVEKLKMLIDEKNQNIADLIKNSTATVNKSDVLNRLDDTRKLFGRQVSPTSDMSAIQGVADDFASHPMIPGASIPVQTAQDMKQGTYKVLAKKYGQLGGAETEAQKALARGLKEEIAKVVPDVVPLNAEESRLLSTLNVTERRALMDLNKNPMGLAALATSPSSWAAFMADRSAGFKALAARQVNKLATPGAVGKRVENLLANPAVRSSLLLTSGS